LTFVLVNVGRLSSVDVERAMTASSLRWRYLSVSLAAGLLALLLAAPAARSQPSSDDLTVTVDQAKLIKLPDRIGTLVIGNPLIVDATLQPGGNVILTGKGYGATNLMALDHKGEVLFEKTVRVEAPRDVVSVYRGADRYSYSCAPLCERQVMLGDSDAAFKPTLEQGVARSAAAQAAGR
jgi:Flp pilus assembly secretin CpaC